MFCVLYVYFNMEVPLVLSYGNCEVHLVIQFLATEGNNATNRCTHSQTVRMGVTSFPYTASNRR